MSAPTIQLFHAFCSVYAPYTQADRNSHIPASRLMLLAPFCGHFRFTSNLNYGIGHLLGVRDKCHV